MKLITRLSAIGILIFALTTAVRGQALFTQFEPATVNAPVGSTFSVNLQVRGFKNIVSFQLPITFNKWLLELVDVSYQSTLPGFSGMNHTPVAIVNGGTGLTGRIVFSWYTDLPTHFDGITLDDNTTLFTFTFKVKANGTTAVNISNVSPGIEVIQGSSTVIPVYYQNGGASITAGTGLPTPGSLTDFKVVANGICIPPGETGCVPVTVDNFTSIQSLQFAIHWNPALLHFEYARNLNLPGWGHSDIVPDHAKGLLKTAWGTPSGLGVTRTNGATLYELCFKAIGSDETADMLKIDGTGFTAEAINDAGIDLAMPGFGVADTVFIDHCSPQTFTATEAPGMLSIPLTVFPNPFTETTQAAFELEKPAQVRLRVTDLAGRVVYEVKNSFPVGQHRLELAHTQLNGPGAYFLCLQIDEQILIRPLFVQ